MRNYFITIVEVTYYNEYEDKEKLAHAIYAGEDYADVAAQVQEDWGDGLISMSMHQIADGEDGGGITISKSMAMALIHDLTDNVICLKTDYRKKREMVDPVIGTSKEVWE